MNLKQGLKIYIAIDKAKNRRHLDISISHLYLFFTKTNLLKRLGTVNQTDNQEKEYHDEDTEMMTRTRLLHADAKNAFDLALHYIEESLMWKFCRTVNGGKLYQKEGWHLLSTRIFQTFCKIIK